MLLVTFVTIKERVKFLLQTQRMSDTKTISLLEKWVELFTDDLYARAYHKTSDSALAEDLTQDTFLAALQNIKSFKGDSSPRTWLFAILNNKIVDHYRKKIKIPLSVSQLGQTEGKGASPFDREEKWIKQHSPASWHMNEPSLLDNRDFLKVFALCMEDLPEKWRLAVHSKYFSDKKGKAISQDLGITTSNYWQILHRAKLQLRKCLEDSWFKK